MYHAPLRHAPGRATHKYSSATGAVRAIVFATMRRTRPAGFCQPDFRGDIDTRDSGGDEGMGDFVGWFGFFFCGLVGWV